jgi:hypothetical protein
MWCCLALLHQLVALEIDNGSHKGDMLEGMQDAVSSLTTFTYLSLKTRNRWIDGASSRSIGMLSRLVMLVIDCVGADPLSLSHHQGQQKQRFGFPA